MDQTNEILKILIDQQSQELLVCVLDWHRKSGQGGDLTDEELNRLWSFTRETKIFPDEPISAEVKVRLIEKLCYYKFISWEESSDDYLRAWSKLDRGAGFHSDRIEFFNWVVREDVNLKRFYSSLILFLSIETVIDLLGFIYGIVDHLEELPESQRKKVANAYANRRRSEILRHAFILSNEFAITNFSEFSSVIGYNSFFWAFDDWPIWTREQARSYEELGVISGPEADALSEFGESLRIFGEKCEKEPVERLEDAWLAEPKWRQARRRLFSKLFGGSRS